MRAQCLNGMLALNVKFSARSTSSGTVCGRDGRIDERASISMVNSEDRSKRARRKEEWCDSRRDGELRG